MDQATLRVTLTCVVPASIGVGTLSAGAAAASEKAIGGGAIVLDDSDTDATDPSVKPSSSAYCAAWA